MSSDAVTYDAVLPERATVRCAHDDGGRWSAGDCPASHLGEDDRHLALVPARAGDTIEVPCPECGGAGLLDTWIDQPDEKCPACSGAGTLRVRLTEDPVHHDEDRKSVV